MINPVAKTPKTARWCNQQTYLGKNQETHYLLPFVFHLFIFIFGLSKKYKGVIDSEIISIVAGMLAQGSSHQFLSGEGNHMAFLQQKAMLR
jgi:hypothetical protein